MTSAYWNQSCNREIVTEVVGLNLCHACYNTVVMCCRDFTVENVEIDENKQASKISSIQIIPLSKKCLSGPGDWKDWTGEAASERSSDANKRPMAALGPDSDSVTEGVTTGSVTEGVTTGSVTTGLWLHAAALQRRTLTPLVLLSVCV